MGQYISRNISKSYDNSQGNDVHNILRNIDNFYEIEIGIVVGIINNNKSCEISVKRIFGKNIEYRNMEFSAFPLDPLIKMLPIIGEFVTLIEIPPSDITQDFSNQISSDGKRNNLFYINIINFNNSTNNNIFNNNLISLNNLGINIDNIDNKNIYNYNFDLNPGDVLFQGRKGNGIRFTETIKNSVENIGNSLFFGEIGGRPLIIISNGRDIENENIINKEESIKYTDSLIMLSSLDSYYNFQINSFLNNTIRNKFNISEGNNINTGKTILLSSDKLIFNSKEKDMLFINNGNFLVLSEKNIYFKVGNLSSFEVDASEINLGDSAHSYLAYGEEVEYAINELIFILTTYVEYNEQVTVINKLRDLSKRMERKLKSKVVKII